jgi:hypothetical protein
MDSRKAPAHRDSVVGFEANRPCQLQFLAVSAQRFDVHRQSKREEEGLFLPPARDRRNSTPRSAKARSTKKARSSSGQRKNFDLQPADIGGDSWPPTALF